MHGSRDKINICRIDVEAFTKDCSLDSKPQEDADKLLSWKAPQKQNSKGQIQELLRICFDVAFKLQVSPNIESCTKMVKI